MIALTLSCSHVLLMKATHLESAQSLFIIVIAFS